MIRALTFDTYGTVVDWRTSVLDELRALADRKVLRLDSVLFLDEWKAAYRPGMDDVNRGTRPWTTVDAIYRRRLVELLPKHGVSLATDEIDALTRVWWRLRPWPDALAGLCRLKRRYILSPLSNASFIGMVELARWAGLPWDCVLSAELFHHYKPDPEAYLGAAAVLGLAPREVMLVAAHKNDLAAARKCGFSTAYVRRPLEHGPQSTPDLTDDRHSTFNADDFVDLARQLGA